MNKIKPILFRLPEYYLMLLALAAGFTPPFSISFIAIILVAILSLQAIFKNKLTGMLIGGLFACGNFFFLLAMLSEFNEFKTFNSAAAEMLLVGIPMVTLNFIMAAAMIWKYAPAEELNVEQKVISST